MLDRHMHHKRDFSIAVLSAVFIGMSTPASAMPILDVEGPAPFSIIDIATRRGSHFAGEPSDEAILSFLEGSAFVNAVAGSDMGFPVFDDSPLAGNGAPCGREPGRALDCWDTVRVALPAAAGPVESSETADSTGTPDQTRADQVAAGADRPRRAPARKATTFVLLTAGFAVAGFAGWRTVLKGRRRRRSTRRRVPRRA